jgi:hypothetical protein
MKLAINEGTSVAVAVDFLDETGRATCPEVATYRLDDERTGEELIGPTSIEPGETAVIEIPRSANAIIGRDHSTENKVLTVEWWFDAGNKGGRDQFVYAVRKLTFGDKL